MSAARRLAISTATSLLTSGLLAHASAPVQAQDPRQAGVTRAPEMNAAALPAEIEAILQDARRLIEEAFREIEADDAVTARARGEEAADLLLPLLAIESVAGSEALRHELDEVARLADRIGNTAREEARMLCQRLVRGFEQAGVTERAELFYARAVLAVIENDQSAAARFYALEIEDRERRGPADDPQILRARGNLAVSVSELGDLARARELQENVLAARERSLPADPVEVLRARANLAITLRTLGDLKRARELGESVLEARERLLPPDHPDLLLARTNLAITLWSLRELPRARALLESALEAYERSLPADHPMVLRTRANLAVMLLELGELARARILQESVLEAYERSLPEDHPDLLRARSNLANTLMRFGDLARARELQEIVLEGSERSLPADNPDLLKARGSLAATLQRLGELEYARELQESVLASMERTLQADHTDVLGARVNLIITLSRLGDLDAVREQQPGLAAGLLRRALDLAVLSPREAGVVAAGDAEWIDRLLVDSRDASNLPSAFEVLETRRHMSQALPQAALAPDPEIEGWRAEAASLRARLSDLVAGRASEGSQEDLAGAVSRLSFERDKVERRIRSRLAQTGAFTDSIRAPALAAVLSQGSAAVGYLRYVHRELRPQTGKWTNEDALLAHVVRADGDLERIELGSASEIEQLVTTWREALGKAIGGRGIDVVAGASSEARELELGGELRRRLLDPVIAAAGDGVSTLHVCLDEMLFLVPLDALPLGEGRVGERYRIVNEVSFARLLAPTESQASEPSLLALGGASFDADLEEDAAPIPATAQADPAERSGRTEFFTPLQQTELEVETLAQLFEQAFDTGAVLLTKEAATKRALHDRAPGARFLHLATHGWFAPESVASLTDAPDGQERMNLEETVIGFAPMTLCGLALAGANQARDGILTAEELASLDLSRCELAVLSACETNVGIRRAGQGILSLQAALHAAGARTAITSLWKVDDAATRRLMELFYTKLWSEKQPKAKALWEAKMALRAGGAPVRDWAGWVLSGDPD